MVRLPYIKLVTTYNNQNNFMRIITVLILFLSFLSCREEANRQVYNHTHIKNYDNGKVLFEYNKYGQLVRESGNYGEYDDNNNFCSFYYYADGLKTKELNYLFDTMNINCIIKDSLNCTKILHEYDKFGNLAIVKEYSPFYSNENYIHKLTRVINYEKKVSIWYYYSDVGELKSKDFSYNDLPNIMYSICEVTYPTLDTIWAKNMKKEEWYSLAKEIDFSFEDE